MESSVEVDAPKLGRLVGAVLAVKGLDLLHVLARDVEVENRKVFLQPLYLGGLGDDHRVPLEAPSEDQLCRRLAVFLSQGLQAPIKQACLRNYHQTRFAKVFFF